MTKEELADKLEAYGIKDLADEVRNSEVHIDDSAHFTIYDSEMEAERGEEGYGNYYHITTEVLDSGETCTAVYGRLVEPEGGTEWMDRDPEYYDIPEGVPETYDDYDDDQMHLEVSDVVAADSEYDRPFFEGSVDNDDDESWMDDGGDVDIG